MTKYDIILEELQNRVDSGEISYEFAESVNELAYDKYVSEGINNKITGHDTRDAIKEINEIKKNIKAITSKCKKITSKSEAESIIKEAKECKENISSLKSKINDLPTDTKSIIAYIAIPLASVLSFILLDKALVKNCDKRNKLAKEIKVEYISHPEDSNDGRLSNGYRRVKVMPTPEQSELRKKLVDEREMMSRAFDFTLLTTSIANMIALLKSKKCDKRTLIKALDKLDKYCDKVIAACEKIN